MTVKLPNDTRITIIKIVHSANKEFVVRQYEIGLTQQLLRAGHVGKRNFPPPAKVSWRSRDGVPHEAEVDIGEIFKDRVVRHNVPREDYREDLGVADPDIVLEVNDRTINVYMRALIPTRAQQARGGASGYSRDELVLAWTKTY